MLERLSFGELPPKHHLALKDPGGRLRYEACLTRKGFDGPYTILYHEHRPQALRAIAAPERDPALGAPGSVGERHPGLSRRHFRTLSLSPGQPREAALLYNQDLVLGCFRPAASDPNYRINAGA